MDARTAAATLLRVTVRALVTPEEAVARIRDGDVIMVGGFWLVGAPLTLIDALVETSTARDLTIVSNNVGEAGRGLGKLLREGRIRKAIASYLISLYCSVAILTEDAIGILDNVEISKYHDYK